MIFGALGLLNRGKRSCFDGLWNEKKHPRDAWGRFAKADATMAPAKNQEPALFQQPSGKFTIYDFGYPRVQPDTSTPARKALVEHEERIRHNDFETGIVVDDQGRTLLVKQGNKRQVGFTDDELEAMRGHSFTHNHPNGLSFSIDDLELACRFELFELRAVSSHVRYMIKPYYHWPNPHELSKFRDKIRTGIIEIIRDDMRTGELPSDKVAQEASHLEIRAIAEHFDLVYIRENS